MPDVTVTIDAQDRATPAINALKGSLQGLSQSAGGLGDAFGKVQSMLDRMVTRMGIMFVLHDAINAIKGAFDAVGDSIQQTVHWQNIMGDSVGDAVAHWGQLQSIAMATGQSLDKTSQRALEFYRLGESFGQAATDAGTLNMVLQRTGVEMDKIIAKGKLRGEISPEEFLTAATAFPQLRGEVPEVVRHERERHFRGLEMQERHRMAEEEMHDEIHQIEVIQSVRRTALQEEREDRRRLAEEQLQDQHRIQQAAEAAAERQHSRTISFAEGIKGLGEYVITGLQKPGEVPLSQLGVGRQMETLKKEYAKGLQELTKEEGVTAAQAGELLGAGVISPQTIMRYAEAAREEERITKEQQRQTEETNHRRQIAAEDREQGRADRRQEAADRADIQALELKFTRTLAAEKREMQLEEFNLDRQHWQELEAVWQKEEQRFQRFAAINAQFLQILGALTGTEGLGKIPQLVGGGETPAGTAEKELAQKTDILAGKTDVHSERLEELRKSTDELIDAMKEKAAGGAGAGGGGAEAQLPPEAKAAMDKAEAAQDHLDAILSDTGGGFAAVQAGAKLGEAERQRAQEEYEQKRQEAIDEAQAEADQSREQADEALRRAEQQYGPKPAQTVMGWGPMPGIGPTFGGISSDYEQATSGMGMTVLGPKKIGGGPAQEETLRAIKDAIHKELNKTLKAIQKHLKEVLTVEKQQQAA